MRRPYQVLVRRSPAGEEQVVAAYDLARDGTLFVTDGAALQTVVDGRTKKLASAKYVQAIVTL
jgi:hypothetical protein